VSEKPIAQSLVDSPPGREGGVHSPATPADAVTPADGAEPEEAVSVLLVGDRPERLLALEAALEPLGQRLDRATSDAEALRRLAAGDVAVVLLDVQMRTTDGFQVARRIRSGEHSRHVPVILLTTRDQDGDGAARAYELGAVDFLSSRVPPEVLRSKVAVFVELHRRLELLRRQERQVRASERQGADEALRAQAASLAATTARLATLNAELQRRQAELQHAIAARNRFYASMSHELRTPINAIIGYGTLLLDDVFGPLTERQRQGLERSHRAATHLLELVSDVLDLSKIEAGRIELALQPVPLASLVEEILVAARPMADARGVTLTLAGDCDVTLVTDPRRVRQIVHGLLSNAIHSGHGSPVELRCAALPDGGVEVAVAGGGPGIPARELDRIFDDLAELPNAHERGPGTGLGLPLARRLARLLGGDLVVESADGEGRTFRLHLPAAAAPDAGQDGSDV
jgi:signal transduction histidine kinase